jgi:hypothetical protein
VGVGDDWSIFGCSWYWCGRGVQEVGALQWWCWCLVGGTCEVARSKVGVVLRQCVGLRPRSQNQRERGRERARRHMEREARRRKHCTYNLLSRAKGKPPTSSIPSQPHLLGPKRIPRRTLPLLSKDALRSDFDYLLTLSPANASLAIYYLYSLQTVSATSPHNSNTTHHTTWSNLRTPPTQSSPAPAPTPWFPKVRVASRIRART